MKQKKRSVDYTDAVGAATKKHKKRSMENGEAVDFVSPPHSFMGIDIALTR